MTTTHAFSLNGKIWLELNDSRQPIAERIHSILSDLDGVKNYSFMLWRMPTGKTLGEVDPAQGEEYMQCAGSAEKMTIEVRRLVDGQPEQLVVGRAEDAGDGPMFSIGWGGDFTAKVQTNELFESVEAAIVFDTYYKTNWIPSNYAVRRVDV